jgi:chemotaxis response regulator CheB
MPKVAYEIGGVGRQLPLEKISERVLSLCNQHRKEKVSPP